MPEVHAGRKVELGGPREEGAGVGEPLPYAIDDRVGGPHPKTKLLFDGFDEFLPVPIPHFKDRVGLHPIGEAEREELVVAVVEPVLRGLEGSDDVREPVGDGDWQGKEAADHLGEHDHREEHLVGRMVLRDG